MRHKVGIRALYVYIAVAIASFIVSNVVIVVLNNKEEEALLTKYDAMISDLRTQFMGQQQMMDSINREEMGWYRTEFDRTIKAKRDEFHQQLIAAHGDISKIREKVIQSKKESEGKKEEVEALRKQNEHSQAHYDQINKIADDHLMDLEQQMVDCEYQKRQKQSELSKIQHKDQQDVHQME